MTPILRPGDPALGQAFQRWLPAQRWFAGKARQITGVQVDDVADLGEGIMLALVVVDYDDGGAERYQLPMSLEGSGQVVTQVAEGELRDASGDPAARARLARLVAESGRVPTLGGATLAGEPVEGTEPAQVPAESRRLGVEQSNTSLVYGDRLILKLFRRLEPGESPEVELTRALTEAGSTDVPAQRGALSLHGTDGSVTALAVLSDYVAGGREGWAVATAEAARITGGTAVGAGGGQPDGRTSLSAQVQELGAAVARVHATLRLALGSRPASREDAQGWAEAMRRQLEHVLVVAERHAPEAAAQLRLAQPDLVTALNAVVDLPDPGPLTRTHGDLHLGQVLLDAGGRWKVLDFEGEPARPLAQRLAPGSPLRDVAGMLRSFDYAAGHALLTMTGDRPAEAALTSWRDELRGAFLDGYLGPARQAGVLPPEDASIQVLLDAFELDKAVYELGYELANRPPWVPIPLGGILRLVHSDRSITTEDAPVANNRRPSMPGAGTAYRDWRADPDEVKALVDGSHSDPHRLLGVHEEDSGAVVRVYRPDAETVEVVLDDGTTVAAERTDDAGLFEARLDRQPAAAAYRLRVRYANGEFTLADPYAFWPTLGEIDLHLAGEGRHTELWRRLGAHVGTNDGMAGTSFAVWAPNARAVRVIGEFNSWDGRLHPMRLLGSGIWELFVPETGNGALYQYEILTAQGEVVTRADPYAFATEVPPGRASRVHASDYHWGDEEWLARRREQSAVATPMSAYEVHLGSWRHRDGRPMSYREMADDLVGHVSYLGFTHVEFLPVAEHPFGGSWGYQVTGYYAPTARFGDPDDFRYLVDRLHQAGIGVIVDWVPAHFPRDEWALARFDGTALYEHADPRQGEHPDWGTLVFNFGRNEVRNFLLANALYWIEELHVDGLRVDAVASMLYLDYSREPDQWVPNAYGGRENLEAVEFLKELNSVVYGRNPDAMVIAEESTAWPGVSRPAHLGGLGFGFKWNMGWMHDTLSYFALDPVYRRFHHHQLTFALMYAYSENFVLPLSHDEVVHGKRSLVDKMPGDRWQKFANLRALYGYMWAHPGKQLLFMGGEFGQWREWSEQRELDWYLLGEADHAGLQAMVADLNARYRELPALWQADSEPHGFQWIDANNADDNVLAFVRSGTGSTPPVACVSNFSATVRSLRIGLPGAGQYTEVLNTDASGYGGSNVGNYGTVIAEEQGWHGQPASAVLSLPPLATLWLARD